LRSYDVLDRKGARAGTRGRRSEKLELLGHSWTARDQTIRVDSRERATA